MSASTNAISDAIENLVETAKTDGSSQSYLIEIISLAQRVIESAQDISADYTPSIINQLKHINQKIADTKFELNDLPSYNQDRAPQAGIELDEIVKATENATNSIMEQAEAILAADSSDLDNYQETVTNAVMQIFEACSFQDITGQRIAKVVDALQYIDDSINSIATTLNLTVTTNENESQRGDEKSLLNGPANEGEGIDQGMVDNLMQTNGQTNGGGTDSNQADIDALFD